MDCLFCKIVSGEIPNYTVYEDDDVLAFLDIHPCSKGHTMVIPKQHFSTLADMSGLAWTKTMAGVKSAMERVYDIIEPDGMNIGINDQPAAGQAVGHVHWHLIPRWDNDGGGSMHSIIRAKNVEEVSKVAESFKK